MNKQAGLHIVGDLVNDSDPISCRPRLFKFPATSHSGTVLYVCYVLES